MSVVRTSPAGLVRPRTLVCHPVWIDPLNQPIWELGIEPLDRSKTSKIGLNWRLYTVHLKKSQKRVSWRTVRSCSAWWSDSCSSAVLCCPAVAANYIIQWCGVVLAQLLQAMSSNSWFKFRRSCYSWGT